MYSTGYNRTLQIQKQLSKTKNHGWARYHASIALAAVGGLFFVLLGFFLPAVFSLYDGNNTALNYAGAGSLIAAFIFFGIAAHFMDKRDDSEHKFNKSRIEKGKSNTKMKKLYTAGFALLLSLLLHGNSSAQQTIFNVPSSDILDKGKVYFELDATFKTNRQDAVGKFSGFVPRVVVGAGGNVEVGLNITGNIQPGADSTTLVPAIKWRPYYNEKKGLSVVVGDHVFIPVRNKSYNIGNYAYVQVSKTFAGTKTRITGGGYYFTKNVVSTAARVGGQFGFEQTVNKYLNINADWFTGKNAAGYFTPGIAFKPHPKVSGYFGYSIGNTKVRQGNHFFYAAIGINLN